MILANKTHYLKSKNLVSKTPTRSIFIKSFGNKRGFKPGKKGDGFRVNRDIFAKEIRLIDPEGKMLGVYSVPDAIRMAEDFGLDLIEIAPNAKPPTCKIMDYGKWKYENKKKANQARKNQVIVEVKEVQLRPRTDQHDFETKARHAKRFLLDDNKVKVNLRFSGREMAHQEEGVAMLNRMKEAMDHLATVEVSPKREGRQMFILLAPDPAKIKEYKKAQGENKASEAEEADK